MLFSGKAGYGSQKNWEKHDGVMGSEVVLLTSCTPFS